MSQTSWIYNYNVRYQYYDPCRRTGNVPEWLRGWPAKPLGSACAGSSPAVVAVLGSSRATFVLGETIT